MHIALPLRPCHEEERILPLINVVFLLLIFFMLAGKLSSGGPFEISPTASISETPGSPENLTVLIGTNGRLALNGRVLDERALKQNLADRMMAEQVSVARIKADGRATTLRVIEIMAVLRETGIKKVQLLTVSVAR